MPRIIQKSNISADVNASAEVKLDKNNGLSSQRVQFEYAKKAGLTFAQETNMAATQLEKSAGETMVW